MTQLTFPVHARRRRPALTDLPRSERPLQRVLSAGAVHCSAVELLAALVGGKEALTVAEQVLARCNSVADLGRLPASELASIAGIGPATLARLLAALELGRRIRSTSPSDRLQIGAPSDAASLVMPEMATLEQEHVRVILLDTRNRVLAVTEVYKGSLNASSIRVGELFREAIRRNAAGIVLCHNHPSGDCSPSPEDVAVTRMVVEAGRLLDVKCLDHLVIGRQRFVSLKERGLGFS